MMQAAEANVFVSSKNCVYKHLFRVLGGDCSSASESFGRSHDQSHGQSHGQVLSSASEFGEHSFR